MVIRALSGPPQFEKFENLFIEVLLSGWTLDQGCHPALDLEFVEDYGSPFRETWGYEFPADIAKEIELLGLVDRQQLVKELGVSIYKYGPEGRWDHLRGALKNIAYGFDQTWGDRWRNVKRD